MPRGLRISAKEPLMPPALIRVHPQDSVAVALRALRQGERLAVDGLELELRQDVALGHKIALMPHKAGDVVRKYGEPIGKASADIAVGDHVHSHNLATALAGELTYTAGKGTQTLPPASAATWRGYRRADGRCASRTAWG